MLAHVLSLIVNQSCHAFAGADPRDPFGDGIFASLTRDMSGSRFPADTFFKISSEASSGSVLLPPLPLLAVVGLQHRAESQLQTRVREDSTPIQDTAVGTPLVPLLDHFHPTHFQILRLSLPLQRD